MPLDPGVDFSRATLDAASFPAFYRKLVLLRFPMPVAQVLELRYVVNHAVDRFREPPDTPDYRQFREALETALDSFGIESAHHRERLLRLLALLRELHVQHSLGSRDRELELRCEMDDNRHARRQTVRLGALWLAVAAGCVLAWLLMPEPGWLVKIAAAGFAYFSFDAFHSLPALDARHEHVRKELNDLLRTRVSSLNWKMLIHKFAFVLGYKRVRGIEVFRPDRTDGGDHPRGPLLH
jgi:hypothetical protein